VVEGVEWLLANPDSQPKIPTGPVADNS
jgi:hypothetical protein